MNCNPVCRGLNPNVVQKQFNISPLSKDGLTILATESHEIPLAPDVAIQRKADVLVPEFHGNLLRVDRWHLMAVSQTGAMKRADRTDAAQ